MTLVADIHEVHGATPETRGGVGAVSHHDRLGRAHRVVRNGVGVIGHGHGVVVVEGEDRVDYADSAMTDTTPDEDGEGIYTLLLDPDGRTETETYVYNAGERLLIFTPRDHAKPLVEKRDSKTFLQRVETYNVSDEFGVFGVHGLQSTEKVTSIFSGASASEPELPSVHGSVGGELGVTVIVPDNPTGEEGHDVICHAKDAENVLDALLFYGSPSVPTGYRTWDSLTVEAGMPFFESELRGNVLNVAGVRNTLDFDKDCFVGQELVSRIENRGRPSRRLIGFRADTLPDLGAEASANGELVGTVTRATESPMLDAPIGFAFVDYSLDTDVLKVAVGGDRVEVTRESLPFIEGSAVSARLPTYLGKN